MLVSLIQLLAIPVAVATSALSLGCGRGGIEANECRVSVRHVNLIRFIVAVLAGYSVLAGDVRVSIIVYMLGLTACVAFNAGMPDYKLLSLQSSSLYLS